MATAELENEQKATSPMDRFDSYVDGVLSGDIVICRFVKLAVERHVRDLDTGESRGLRFDRDEAEEAIRFIECLKHSKGEWAGKNLRLEPWQCFIIGSMFGWKGDDGTRRFRSAYEEVSRKNGKSTKAAGVGLKLFVFDDEPGAEVYSSATKRDQAKIVHEEAKRMVRKSALGDVVRILRDNMFYGDSIYQPLGSDEDTLDGLNVSGGIIDELHAHRTRGCWDVLETATGARRQPLLYAITTAGEGGNNESICWELRSYTIKVLEGIVDDDTWFGIIFTLDEGDEWDDEDVWIKANPNLGVSVSVEDLRRKCKKAKETPAAQNNFRRKHCDEWVESAKAWLSAGLWDKNRGDEWYGKNGLLDGIRDRYRGMPCWVGGDLSSTQDLTGVVAVIPNGEWFDVFPFVWCPRDNAIGRSKDKRIPYTTWSDMGQLFLTQDNYVDYGPVKLLLQEMRDEWGWDVQEIALDPHNAQSVFSELVSECGYKQEQVIAHRQGPVSMNDPIKQTERLLLAEKIRHGGHRPLAWCVSNVVADTDKYDNVAFNKKKSIDKIDLAVALVMGVGRAVGAQPTNRKSYYEDNDIEFF